MKRAINKFSSTPGESMRLFRKENDIALLARKTGSSHTVLLDRLNPDRDQKLGYLEAIGHSHLTDDHVLLKAWANELGYGLFEKPTGIICDESMLSVFLAIQAAQGDFATQLNKALEDKVIDKEENSLLASTIDQVINQLASLKAEINSQVREVQTNKGTQDDGHSRRSTRLN